MSASQVDQAFRVGTGARAAVAVPLKRGLDVAVGVLLLVVLAPLLLGIAVLVAVSSRGPVLYRQVRVGRGGQEFTMLKFRSMQEGAEEQVDLLRGLDEADGPLFKVPRDPRVTGVGRWLRRLSLDELPQLVNVVSGSMSLVGPRPALPAEVARFEPHVRRRHDVRPGMTGLWQVSGRIELSWDTAVRLDLHYVDHWSLWLDLVILLRTLPAVVGSRGAY